MRLTREERERILAGDYTALKREDDPGDVEGQVIALRRSLPRKRVVYEDPKFSGQRREIVGVTEEPEYRSFWLELGKPKRHRKGHWQIELTVHDERQAARTLRAGGPPGISKGGLKTRLKDPERVKGERGQGVGSFTEETARGYGGAGAQALDYGGVDDDDLRRLRVQADERWARHLQETASESELRKQERRARNALRDCLDGLDPMARSILLAKIEGLIEDAGEKASDLAA